MKTRSLVREKFIVIAGYYGGVGAVSTVVSRGGQLVGTLLIKISIVGFP